MPQRTRLEGASNFRDFGGWATEGGRKVRTGVLYRSNALANLSGEDRRVLNGLGLKVVHDLRSRAEREAAPTAWTYEGLVTKTYKPTHKRRLVEMALDYPADEPGVRRLMYDFYSDLPLVFAPTIAGVIGSILEGRVPCIVHCSAGKDRTGIVCAILLAALGVPRSLIVQDYQRSGLHLRARGEMAQAFAPREDEDALRRRLPPEAIAAMMSADAAYIEASLAAIDRRFVHMTDYLTGELQLDASRLEKLREQLLVPAVRAGSSTVSGRRCSDQPGDEWSRL